MNTQITPPIGAPLSEERISFGEALRQLYAIYRRRQWVIWPTAAAVILIGAAYIFQITPTYTATASVMLDTRQGEVVDIEAVRAGLPVDTASVETEVGIIRSRSLLRQVAEQLDLADTPQFNPSLRRTSELQRFTDSVKGVFTGILRTAGALRAPPPAPPADELAARERLMNGVIDRLRAQVQASRVGLTYLINISVTSTDPKMAAEIANTVAQVYLVQQLEAKFDAAERANRWLSERLGELRAEVETAEAAVERYRAEAGLMMAAGSTLTESQIVDITGQLSAAQAELAERQARLSAVRRRIDTGGSADVIAEVLNSEVVRQLRAQYATVARRRAELEGTLGPKHPDLLQVQRELADLNAQIGEEVGRIVVNLENEVAVAQRRVDSLRQSRSEIEARQAANNAQLVELRELERNAESVRALYESFLARFRETNEQRGMALSDAQRSGYVVSEAVVPGGPSAPRTKLLLFAVILLGGAAGAGLAILLEILDLGYSSPEEVARHTAAPVLGHVPLLRTDDRRMNGELVSPTDYLTARPLSTYAEAYRAIKASLFLSSVDTRPQVIQLTSSLPGEGKTETTIGLGRTLARSGLRVLVVDADLRRRDLTHRLKINRKAGLLEVLEGKAQLADALVTDDATGMSILPLSNASYLPADVFGSAAFTELVEAGRGRFDVVLFDSAPLFAVADTLVLAQKADSVILMVQWRNTPRTVVQSALNELGKVRARIGGIILSRMDMRAVMRYSSPHLHYEVYTQYYHN